MADSLSVLFQLKAQNQASPVVQKVQSDVTKLTKSASADFNALQSITTSALSKVSSSLTNLAGQLPVVGSAVTGLSDEMSTLAGTSTATGSSIAALAGPIGIAVTATAALAYGVFQLGEGLFTLAKNTAEFQGKLFDLSQQTGVSVETLSALEIAAANTGGNIEAVTASLGIFQKNMEASTDQTSSQAEAFKKLGVEVTDTEQTLRDTLLALSKLPEGYRQTALALEIFGRGGKQLLAITKETNGDLDKLIESLREMGLVTTDQAANADQFNDQLNSLSFQMRGLGTRIIPLVTDVVKDLSEALKDNKDGASGLKFALEGLAFLFTSPLKGAIFTADNYFSRHRNEVQLVINAYNVLSELLSDVTNKIPAVAPPKEGGESGLALLRELQAIHRSTPKLPNENPLASIPGLVRDEKAEREAEAAEKRRLDFILSLNVALKKLRDELNGVNTATRTYAVEQEIANGILKDASEAEQNQARAVAKNIDNRSKQLEIQKRLGEFLKEQDKQVQIAIKGNKTQLDVASELIASLEKEGAVLQDKTKLLLQINSLVLDLNNNLRDLPDNIQRAAEAFGQIEFPAEGQGPFDLSGVGEAPPVPELFDPGKNVFADIQHEMEKTLGLSNELAVGLTEILGQSMSQLASAAGEAVRAFVLFGGAGTSFRKFAAEAIAAVAQMAAVQAIWEGAQALAMLALNFFFPNPKYIASAKAHGLAALMYGSIAGVAAGAGRLVAGDEFREGGGSGGGGATRDNRPLPSNSGPTPIEIGRNNSQAPAINLNVNVTRDAGSIVEVMVQDVRSNGAFRQTMIEEVTR